METVRDRMDEQLRVLRLVEAQRMAQAVFARVSADGVIAAAGTRARSTAASGRPRGRWPAPRWPVRAGSSAPDPAPS
ncbi:hypothetical protein ACIP46_17305 [Streptomyces lavendulae]|uniref:hypothetical protein n=1 Tax=Streptomyces lavendulae TaxID=1914 RepID=UPI00382CEB14